MKQNTNYEVYLLDFEDLQETFEEMNE
jgi:uncharacterized phage-like protein YoqJ